MRRTAVFSVVARGPVSMEDDVSVEVLDPGPASPALLSFMSCGLQQMVRLALVQGQAQVPRTVRFHAMGPEPCSRYEVEVVEWQPAPAS